MARSDKRPSYLVECVFCGSSIENGFLWLHVSEEHPQHLDGWERYDALRRRKGKGVPVRRKLIKLYGNRCIKCGERVKKLTVDHVVPRSKGGPSRLSNYQPMCAQCNQEKSNGTGDYR